jgi:cystathionine beta-lyase
VKEDTKIVHEGRDPEANHGIINPPVYHASTIAWGSVAEMKRRRDNRWEPGVYTYGRHGTPTHEALEEAYAAISGGYRSVAVSSGLAAINAAMLAYLKQGDHVLMVDCVYGPARNFCDNIIGRFGVTTTYYDPAIGAGIKDLIQDNTKIVYVEAPGSQTFEMQDIDAIAAEAHKRGCVVIMDDTWSAGIFYKPFEHGVDVCAMAATKYIVGHSDVMMGLITTTEEQWPIVRPSASALGCNSGPDDVYLALRGLRTIKVRMERHMATGITLAKWLQKRPEVDRVLHPALPEFPGHELWKRDFTGASGLFSFVLKEGFPEDRIEAMLDGMKLYAMGASWGGFESLIMPANPGSNRTATTWDDKGQLIRIHAGLEDPEDLIEDLEEGFGRLNGKND